MGFSLKVKTKQGILHVQDLTSENTLEDLKTKLSALTNIATDRLNVLIGFPPKLLDITTTNSQLTVGKSGICSGETLIVDEKSAPATDASSATSNAATSNLDEAIAHQFSTETKENFDDGILLKEVVPSDNSCLFTSIGTVFVTFVDGKGY